VFRVIKPQQNVFRPTRINLVVNSRGSPRGSPRFRYLQSSFLSKVVNLSISRRELLNSNPGKDLSAGVLLGIPLLFTAVTAILELKHTYISAQLVFQDPDQFNGLWST
jgi:hypothetical protein